MKHCRIANTLQKGEDNFQHSDQMCNVSRFALIQSRLSWLSTTLSPHRSIEDIVLVLENIHKRKNKQQILALFRQTQWTKHNLVISWFANQFSFRETKNDNQYSYQIRSHRQ
jgi:hypothetical protein